MPEKKEHYTLVVEVHHTERVTGAPVAQNSSSKREVARLVLRDSSLDGLLNQAQKHLGLIQDHG